MKHHAHSRRIAAAAAALLLAAGLTACGGDDGDAQAADGTGETSYPMTLTSPHGETELESKPSKVAVVSDIDLDIALALGVEPVIAPKYGDVEISEWTQNSADDQGFGDVETYDASDGTDYEAIAAAEPDLILATSGYSLEDDYEQLSKIAPIVSYQDDLMTMTWQERTDAAAQALDLQAEAEALEKSVADEFDAVKQEHPEFEGTTFTYANVHPDQISYESYEGADNSFFEGLGFVLPDQASEISADNLALSKENIDQLDADVLFMAYPFGDEGLMTKDQLEKDKLFQSLSAVRGGNYAVIPEDLASPLTYKTPLSVPWVLEQLTPVLAKAVAGSN